MRFKFTATMLNKRILRLSFDYFEGKTEISSKEEHEFLREQYPDTYGSRGAGLLLLHKPPEDDRWR